MGALERKLLTILALAVLVAAGCKDRDDDDTAADDDTADDDDTDQPCQIDGLPQAIHGAAWVNPVAYPTIPVRIDTGGVADTVQVTVDGTSALAEEQAGGVWIADLPVDGLEDGIRVLEVTATCDDGSIETAQMDLGIGTEGVQLTDFDEVGHATTPRIHRAGDDLWLTWVAEYDGKREAWLQAVDGAGRWLGERVQLTGADDNGADTIYAFTAIGESSVGVLYQEPGGPYIDRIVITDMEGNERLAIDDLVPNHWFGSARGDMTFDGEAFIAAYRLYDDQGASEIRWLRIDEQTLAVTGPITVAESGAGDPISGFEPFVFIKVASIGDVSMVAFVRNRYDSWLEMDLPKSQLATLDTEGNLVNSIYAGSEGSFTFHWDCRVSSLGDEFLAVWSLTDLTDPDPDSPTLFEAATGDATGELDLPTGQGWPMMDGVYDRMDPFAIAHPEHSAVLAWTDLRSYVESPETGLIELWVAPLDDEFAVFDEVVFTHARFIAGSSELNAAAAGTNVIVAWEDERHGNGIMDARPEVWLETAWF